MSALKFRNVAASVDDPVETWPFEGSCVALPQALANLSYLIWGALGGRPGQVRQQQPRDLPRNARNTRTALRQ